MEKSTDHQVIAELSKLPKENALVTSELLARTGASRSDLDRLEEEGRIESIVGMAPLVPPGQSSTTMTDDDVAWLLPDTNG